MHGDGLRSSVVFLYPANFLKKSDREIISGVALFFEYLQFNILHPVLRLLNSSVRKVLTAVDISRINISGYVVPRLVYRKF